MLVLVDLQDARICWSRADLSVDAKAASALAEGELCATDSGWSERVREQRSLCTADISMALLCPTPGKAALLIDMRVASEALLYAIMRVFVECALLIPATQAPPKTPLRTSFTDIQVKIEALLYSVHMVSP